MDDRREAFNQQMNEWAAKQGLWFQLRHTAGSKSSFSWLARLALRFAILLVLCGLGCWLFLIKRVESESFKEYVRSGIEKTLNGEDCKLGSIKKERGIAAISQLDLSETNESFFHHFHAREINLNMSLTAGLLGQWDGGAIFIDYLNIDLKAGESDDEKAASSYASLFPKLDKFKCDRLDVKAGDVYWGYTPQNKGSITGSHITVTQDNKGWRVVFRGGLFSQNWLRRLDIVKIEALCTDQGLQIESAELNSGQGSLSFQAEVGKVGKPDVKGSLVFKSLPLNTMLPSRYSEWIDGHVSGKGKIFGSSNSQYGIGMDINLSLDKDSMTVRHYSLPILSALSVVDVYNNYRKIVFSKGGCHILTGGGKLKVDQIDLKAGELFQMKGAFEMRPPNYEEIAKALGIENVEEVRDVIEKNWEFQDKLIQVNDSATTLADAAKGIGEVVSAARNQGELEDGNILTSSILTEKNILRFDGSIQAGLPIDAFDKASTLKEKYLPDLSSNRIWIEIPLKGGLKTLTLKQAEELYVLGRNRR